MRRRDFLARGLLIGGVSPLLRAQVFKLTGSASLKGSPSLTSPVPTGLLFYDDFSDGNFSKWAFQNIGGNQSVVSSPVYDGDAHSASFLYNYTAGLGGGEQDVWAQAVFAASSNVYVSAKIYNQAPTVGESAGLIVQRKTFWLSDSASPGDQLGTFQVIMALENATGGVQSPTNQYFILGAQGTGGAGGVCGMSSTTLYVPSSVTLLYNAWYTVELQVKLNTPSMSDGELHLWVNGTDVYDATGLTLRGTCSTGLQSLSLGDQADTTVAGTVDRTTFFGRVTVNDGHYIAP